VLGLISIGFLIPYVYVRKSGYGLFSFYSDNTWKLPVAVLIWHTIWGGLLGQMYNPSSSSADA
jgi:RsiW-degrading membrane proteinase PrsW (M82 family)